MIDPNFDVVVIGAGMAGLSVAAELSRNLRVAVIERESQPGYHATGRSAALYSELYGNAVVRSLTRASRPFYFDTPEGFSGEALVAPRGSLFFGGPDEADALDGFAALLGLQAGMKRLDAAAVEDLLPVFRPGYLTGGLYETGSADIDVAAVLQGYAVQCRRRNVHLEVGGALEGLERVGGRWQVRTRSALLSASIVVNAAGAWGDELAAMAGVASIGLVPKRRTAILIEVPNGAVATHWPAAIHVNETFYFKPDAGLLLVSPADESPSAPCDAQPEELDIAIAVDRFETASGASVRKIRSSWAGLRTFVADKTPVVGFDAAAEGFFWLVGQGGYGIQMAPALARAACELVQGKALPSDLADEGLTASALVPNRPGVLGLA